MLRILLGQLSRIGSVKIGTNLTIGYFDQVRDGLSTKRGLQRGQRQRSHHLNGSDRHVIGYLKGFLFTPERARTAIKHLSGGEVNRVLLAKLFTQTNNLMVLDEPTNDLDIEMLEVLEEKLVEYGGTLIVVSHDRDFVDNVVTSTLVFEENNRLIEYQAVSAIGPVEGVSWRCWNSAREKGSKPRRHRGTRSQQRTRAR